MSYTLSTQSSFDSTEENDNKFNNLNSSSTNINTNVYYFKKDYNSTQNTKKVSFSSVQFIKVQSYKKYNRTHPMNNPTILLEQNEINCNCQCLFF